MASIFKRTADLRDKGKPYLISYNDEHGKRHTVAGCTDRVATEEIARKLETDARLRKRGILDAAQERVAEQGRRLQAQRPLDAGRSTDSFRRRQRDLVLGSRAHWLRLRHARQHRPTLLGPRRHPVGPLLGVEKELPRLLVRRPADLQAVSLVSGHERLHTAHLERRQPRGAVHRSDQHRGLAKTGWSARRTRTCRRR